MDIKLCELKKIATGSNTCCRRQLCCACCELYDGCDAAVKCLNSPKRCGAAYNDPYAVGYWMTAQLTRCALTEAQEAAPELYAGGGKVYKIMPGYDGRRWRIVWREEGQKEWKTKKNNGWSANVMDERLKLDELAKREGLQRIER